MTTETESIDRLFLELSQFTRATTAKEMALHTAVCNAVAILNSAPEVATHAEGREVRDILRQALECYAGPWKS